MTTNQFIGLLLIGLGAYFIICSTVMQSFFLYRLIIQRWEKLFGEDNAHRIFRILGIVFVVGGALRAMDLWRP